MSLDGVEIAVSVSEPDPGELAARGVSKQHVDFAFDELVRQLLSAGANIGYGGDLRANGYTEKLILNLRRYRDAERPGSERVHQYLAWPAWARGPAERRGDLNEVADVDPIAAPVSDPPDPSVYDGDPSPYERAVRADATTAMRERMTQEMGARVILGGRLTSHTSRYPGVVEEAYLAMRARKPIFVLGGFGGCASCLAQVLSGELPEALTLAYQRAHTPGFPELEAGLGGIDYDAMLDTLRRGQVPNGLSAEENAVLWNTADLDLAVAHVIRGVSALFGS